ncbi:MAG: RsmE family RNA methyltransferase [Tissierella sp.]|uniref:RsmE family RNA methyltransferase n=1 Tax=Tissierella sp. TaxID=41274 RepID=UPI003F990E25
MHRFFVNKKAIKDKEIKIRGKDFNHIKNVLRMGEGDKMEISSQEKLYLGEIITFLEDSIIINILESEELSGNDVEIRLFQGLAKGSKMDLIIQKGTEIGIKKFYAVSTHRTVVKINNEKKKKARLKRWNTIAEEAAKQSKRDHIPEVKDILTFKSMVNILKTEETIIIPYEDEENISIGKVLKKVKSKNKKRINLIIGPEGGFEMDEIEAMKEIGGKVVTLGSKILRTETAGFVASTIILYEFSEIGVI